MANLFRDYTIYRSPVSTVRPSTLVYPIPIRQTIQQPKQPQPIPEKKELVKPELVEKGILKLQCHTTSKGYSQYYLSVPLEIVKELNLVKAQEFLLKLDQSKQSLFYELYKNESSNIQQG